MEKKVSMRDKMMGKMFDRLSDKKGGSGVSYLNLNGKKIEFFNPQAAGVYTITIIPYTVTGFHPHRIDKGDEWYTRPFQVHKGLGVDGKTTKVCRRTFDKKCPVCQMYYDHKGDDDYKHFKPKWRNLYFVYVEEQSEKGLMLYDMPDFWFEAHIQSLLKTARDIISREEASEQPNQKKIDKAKDQLFFFMKDSSYSIQVRLEKKPFQGKDYFPATSITFVEREEVPEEIYEEVFSLDEVFVEPSYEELEELLYSGVAEEEDNDEDDDLPVDCSVKEESEDEVPTRKGRDRVEPKEEEEVKEEPPATSRRSRRDKPNCPHGHKFGDDWNKKDECSSCEDEFYNKCEDAQD